VITKVPAGSTSTEADVPVSDVVVSFAVIDCDPNWVIVAKKDPIPPLTTVSAGNTACGSVLVKCTVPE
jgi:hypothetical protein